MNYIFLILISTILFIAFLVLNSIINVLKLKKEIIEKSTEVKVEKKFIKVNQDDLKVVLDMIEETTNNIAYTELKGYYDSKYIINDKTFNDLTELITINIYHKLSSEYLELIEQYVSNSEEYIFEKVYYRVLSIVLSLNENNIK